jgi:hypothetical protein
MTLQTSNRLYHPSILTFENNGEASVLLSENAVRLVMSVTEGMEATVGGSGVSLPDKFWLIGKVSLFSLSVVLSGYIINTSTWRQARIVYHHPRHRHHQT